MSGHSKWSTIKRKKAAVDAKRSKIWTKIIKEITVAARIGGGDPAGNPRLRLALDKAKSANMTKDAIKRAIDKGTGESGGADFEDVIYEGYAPGGVAVLVECMTDNRNRTVGEVRHGFDKFGGNLGQNGSVAYLFNKRGMIHVLKEKVGEDRLMEAVLEAGGEELTDNGEIWTVETDPGEFLTVKEALEGAGIELEDAEVDNVPDTRVPVEGDVAKSVLELVSYLEDLDDVQNVYANYDVSDDDLERYGG